MRLYKLGIEKSYEHLKFRSVLRYMCLLWALPTPHLKVLIGHFSEIGDGFLTVAEFEHSHILDICTYTWRTPKLSVTILVFMGISFFGWFFSKTRCFCSLSNRVGLCTKGLCYLIVTLCHSHVQPDTCLVLWTLNRPKSTIKEVSD